MRIELVTHVFGPFYARLLACQLRSLSNHENAKTEVFYDLQEIYLIRDVHRANRWQNVLWRPMSKQRLLNRTIGRNLAAKSTTADWVWFTDADYLFGPGSLEALTDLDPHSACMVFPQTVHKSQFFFDDEPDAVFDYSRYVAERQRKAIGGIQIVPGHIARQYGYLDGVERWQQPAIGDRMYNPKEDHHYRRWLVEQTGLPIVAVDIPSVYRIRHRIPTTSVRHRLLPLEDT